MKKLLAMLMALAMVLALAACGGSGSPSGSGSGAAPDGSAASASVPGEASDAEPAASAPAEASAEAPAGDDAEAPDADGTVYKVGIVNYVDDASLNQIVANVKAELDAKSAELGVTFDYSAYDYNAQADAGTLTQIGATLVADEVDVIVAVATPTASVMLGAVEDTDIPVIFSACSNPVGAGLIASMDAPGVNMTGTSDALDTDTIMELMLATDPDLAKVGLLYDTAQDASTSAIEAAIAWCEAHSIAYVEKTGSTTDDVSLAADSLIADGVDAVFTPTDNTIMTAELSIYEKFLEAGIPHYCGADSFALNGAFLGYGVDYANLGVMTADMVVDVLVNGADPATTPVMTFDNGIASINTETCEALGYDLAEIEATFGPMCTQIVELQTAENFE